jgi:hypothetical protein
MGISNESKTPDNIETGVCGDCLDRIELNAASCQAEQYVNPTAESWEMDAASCQVRQKYIDPWTEFSNLIDPDDDSPPEAIAVAAWHTRVPAVFRFPPEL